MIAETCKFADPLEEIYAIRRKISSQYGNNVRQIASAVARRTAAIRQSGRIVISSPEELARRYAQLV